MAIIGHLSGQEHGPVLRGHGLNIVGTVSIVDQLSFEKPVQLSSCVLASCQIGAYSYVSNSTRLHHTKVGRYCSVADNIVTSPGDHPVDRVSTSAGIYTDVFGWYKKLEDYEAWNPFDPVTIRNDVWVCTNATILGGVTVGDGAIIAAGAVVSKNVEPYQIVGGVPARVIRSRFSDSMISKLLELKIWEYDLLDLSVRTQLDLRRSLSFENLNAIEDVLMSNHDLRFREGETIIQKQPEGGWKLSPKNDI